MIRWVFLDIGGVILDEDVLAFHVFLRHAEAIRRDHPERTVRQLIDERASLAIEGSRWPLFELMSRYVDDREIARTWDHVDREIRSRYGDFLPPIAGSVEAISSLARRYRLGLIANQPAAVRESLERLGLLGLFSVLVLSEEVGLYKPDAAIFRFALAEACVSPEEAVMIGDRPEADILPAEELGMRTILLRRDRSRAPETQPESRDFDAFRRSLDRIEEAACRRLGPRAIAMVPDLAEADRVLDV